MTVTVATRRSLELVPVASPAPRDCPLCGGWMRRDVSPLADPGTDGHPVVDERDECQSCGYEAAVFLVEGFSLGEIRDRVAIVQAHRDVLDHSGCDEQQSCRVERPGIPSVPPIGR